MSDERLRATLGTPPLEWLIARTRQRLERGLDLHGAVQLREPTRGQRAAVEALLGRPPRRAATLTVDLRELDRLITAAGLAQGLRDAIERLTGPVHDRRAAATQRERAWHEAIAGAQERIRGRVALEAWLIDVTAGGLLRRLARGEATEAARLLARALDIADRLPTVDPIPLAELAAGAMGNSHALDVGAPIGTLTVRAAARIAGIDLEDDANGRRDAWAAVGVLCDDLSAPVLVLNLTGDTVSVAGRMLNLYAEAGEPARLSLRQLLRYPPQLSTATTGHRAFICENATVVAAVADRLGPHAAPLICLEGQRKTAARVLLNLLSAAGVALSYHGDFDWGGLRIGNVVMREHGAQAWRFRTHDYRATVGGDRLEGDPVSAIWDEELSDEMRRHRRAVHEEQVLPALLADLAATRPSGTASPVGHHR